MSPIYSVLSDGKIIVPTQREADHLHSDGYGIRRDTNTLSLMPYEVLYLVEKNKIAVVHEKNREKILFKEILHKFNKKDPGILSRFLVYKDLRERGFVPQEGFGYGIDFFVWKRGKYHEDEPAYLIYVISEGSPIEIGKLKDLTVKAKDKEKILKLAVLDRHGEVIYYNLQKMNFKQTSNMEK